MPAASAAADINAATITPSASRALFHSYQVARSSGSTYIDPEHLFFALVLGQDAPAGQVLAPAKDLGQVQSVMMNAYINAGLTILFLLISALSSLVVPSLAGRIIDQGFVERNLDAVGEYGLLALVLLDTSRPAWLFPAS